ncbi:tetraspanin-20-like [Elaeis guineensis]|uniref:tetraspanin-20-like n=1 Tax=Elaeis guineensis var. tenera TaxID=51953 RepID=UPI003C6D1882
MQHDTYSMLHLATFYQLLFLVVIIINNNSTTVPQYNVSYMLFLLGQILPGVMAQLVYAYNKQPESSTSSFILSRFAVLITILILLEAALVGVLVLDKHWEEDLPFDSTGELNRLCAFIEENMDICKWVALTVTVIQALSLLLAVLSRAMVPARRVDYESDEDFIVARRPLLSPQGGTTYPTTSGDSKGFHSDFWSSQLGQNTAINSPGEECSEMNGNEEMKNDQDSVVRDNLMAVPIL